MTQERNSTEQDMTTSVKTRTPINVWLRAIGGMALLFLGFGVWMLLIDIPWIRSSGIPMLAIMLVGTILAWSAARGRKKWVGIVAGTLCTAGFLYSALSFHVVKLPQAIDPPVLASSAAAVDFSLPNQSGDLVSLSDYTGTGPALVVFYRGHW